jgi:membrane associated rhomboid family serine protease
MQEYVDFMLEDEADIPGTRAELNRAISNAQAEPEPPRICPRCGASMRKFNYAYDSNIILDKCPDCGGIWTDRGEIRALASYMKGHPKLDKLGRSLAAHTKKRENMKELAEATHSLTSASGLRWVLMPKIILPLKDDITADKFPIFVLGIITANVIAFLCTWYLALDPREVIETYGLIPSAVLSGEAYGPFITSMFLHGGWEHLIFNMFFLWLFGDNIEDALGHIGFVGFYLLIGVLADLPHIAFSPASQIPAIGASGAVAGLMGAYLVLYPYARIKTLFVFRIIDVPAVLYLGIWIGFQLLYGGIYSVAGIRTGIGYSAHIGGFLAGMVLMWLYRRARSKRQIS